MTASTGRDVKPSASTIGSVGAAALADRFDTPLYVYDLGLVETRARRFMRAFAGADTLIAYSVKANGNLAVLRRLASLGCGADVTSAGELYRATRAGIDPDEIVFAGVGKSEAEIRAGLSAGIYSFNVESASELRRLDALARSAGVRAGFGVRVNPDVDAPTPHAFTRTGRATDKFGVPWEDVRGLFSETRGSDSLRPLGLAVHIGSQIVEIDPYLRALDRITALAGELIAGGIPLSYLDIGGGFGISYGEGEGLDIDGLAALVVPRVRELGLRLVLEPGRAIVGEAGVLLTRVEYVKRSGGKTFVVVDGGMSELLRPSHYGGFHEIEVVGDGALASPWGAGGTAGRSHELGTGSEIRGDAAPTKAPARVDVVGPVCESGDFLARDRLIERMPREGDLLAVHTVGAYGFAMASNYNSRPRPAEVVVSAGRAKLARRRESLEDLVRGEDLQDHLCGEDPEVVLRGEDPDLLRGGNLQDHSTGETPQNVVCGEDPEAALMRGETPQALVRGADSETLVRGGEPQDVVRGKDPEAALVRGEE